MRRFAALVPIGLSALMLGGPADVLADAAVRRACTAAHGKVVNVREFAAEGNGTTDDTAAIQAAADCALSLFVPDASGRAGSSLYFPPGTYLVRKQIALNPTGVVPFGGEVVIRGAGAQQSRVATDQPSGIFGIILYAHSSAFGSMIGVEVRDIGLLAEEPGAGVALEVTPPPASYDPDRIKYWPTRLLRMENVDIAGANGGYFDFGLRATGLKLPLLENVHMTGGGGTACYYFGISYGIFVDHSSCSGPQYGVDLPQAAEGDFVMNSTFTNVGTGIHISVDPYRVPGPSNLDGKIENNIIEARMRGVDVTYKAFIAIANNTFSNSGTASYQDVVLNDTTQSFVDHNTFAGSGGNRTGVALTHSPQDPYPHHYNGDIVANNSFGVQTGIDIGPGVMGTIVLDNVSATARAMVDQGNGTAVVGR